MFTTSFYSYKGGVGRTMALVNTALLIAKRGRKVLVVDFDLEAPSLPTYDFMSCADETPGIVDYVSDYLAAHIAPVASKYIAECEVAGQRISVMPAGNSSGGYGSRLQAIDWEDLYENHSGFLLLEDLKQQWEALGFDYVLIDSRTGHTDVGGICTRQLPDLVVAMFVPNEQNINGLEQIVSAIYREATLPAPKRIGVLFCPSNVPDLDDEKSILEGMLARAKSRLRYERVVSTIHHYPSLDVLAQRPFVLERPTTKLSREYAVLADGILASNRSDRDGAVMHSKNLLRLIRDLTDEEGSLDIQGFIDDIGTIQRNFPDDAEISFNLSTLHSIFGDLESEVNALSTAIDGNFMVDEAHRRRASAYLQLGRKEEGISDLRSILLSESVEAGDLISSIEMLKSVSDEWISFVSHSPAVEKTDPSTKSILLEMLQVNIIGHEVSSRLARSIMEDPRASDTERYAAKNSLALSTIGLGLFSDAMALIEPDRRKLEEATADRIGDVFNYAMAEWGLTGHAPKDLLGRAIELTKDTKLVDPNFSQCLAMAHFAVGNTQEALEKTEEAMRSVGRRARIFSCWRYIVLPRPDFVEDLNEMSIQGRAGNLRPGFLTAA